MRRPRTRTVVAAGIGLAVVASLGVVLLERHDSTPAAPTTTPTADTQLTWFVGATEHLPLAVPDLKAHFTPAFIKAVQGTTGFDEIFQPISPLKLVSSRPTGDPDRVSAVVSNVDASGLSTKYLMTVSVDHAGLIDGVHHSTLLPSPTSWSAVDHRLASLAPDVSFVTSRIDARGRCHVVHGLHADTPRPLASSFKLYVLGALARAVADHHARWDQRLAIRDAWKSAGAGTWRNRPAGTKPTLEQYADQMISISDNTAADHLVHFLGQAALHRQLRLFGSRHASFNTPFLTTRQLFTLTGHDYPRLADRYVAASPNGRARILRQTARLPLSAITSYSVPHDVDAIQWFASPTDICRAFSGLRREDETPGLAPVGAALSIYDGGLLLNSADYPTTWFKGGSTPGVLTWNYLVKAADGTTLVSSVMLSDPHHFLDAATIDPAVEAVIRGSLRLADPRVGSTG